MRRSSLLPLRGLPRVVLVVSPFALLLALGRAGAAPGNDTGAPSSTGSLPPAPSPPPGPSQTAPKKPRAEPGLSAEASLARATAFYEAGQYAQCADAFAALLEDAGPTSSLAPRAREQGSVFYAACLIALGRQDEA